MLNCRMCVIPLSVCKLCMENIKSSKNRYARRNICKQHTKDVQTSKHLMIFFQNSEKASYI